MSRTITIVLTEEHLSVLGEVSNNVVAALYRLTARIAPTERTFMIPAGTEVYAIMSKELNTGQRQPLTKDWHFTEEDLYVDPLKTGWYPLGNHRWNVGMCGQYVFRLKKDKDIFIKVSDEHVSVTGGRNLSESESLSVSSGAADTLQRKPGED